MGQLIKQGQAQDARGLLQKEGAHSYLRTGYPSTSLQVSDL